MILQNCFSKVWFFEYVVLFHSVDLKTLTVPRCKHDHCHAQQGNGTANHIEFIRNITIDFPSPKDSQNDENTAISGINSSEICWLKRGNHSVQSENYQSDCTEPERFIFFQPKPHEIPATYFTNASKNKY